MNYLKIYNEFINYCNNTDVIERLRRRHINDYRIDKGYIYLENHHIIPKHDNGSDNKENYVLLLPEEHIFAHQVRWKAYKQRGDMLAVRFCLNGILGEKNKELSDIKIILTKKVRQGYSWMKQNSAEVRKTHGWQTENGRNRISEARKGTMPVKDLNGNMIGSVSCTHPKVISGEWVHHSTGCKRPVEENKRRASPGEQNGRYSGYTDKEIVEYGVSLTMKMDKIVGYKKMVLYAGKENINFPKSLSKFRFNGNGAKEYIRILKEKTGLEYNPFAKSEETKEKLRQANLNNKGKN